MQIVENRGVRYQSTAMDSRIAPFDNNDARLALKYAVGRDDLLQKVNRGFGAVGNDHPVPPNDPYFNEDLPQRPYDPDKAKYHAKKGGLTQVDLSAADTAFTGAVDAAVLCKEYAKPAGIEINVIREPNDGYWSNVWMQKPYSMVNWAVRPTPTIHFSLAYKCGAPWNDSYICIDRFESLLKESKVTTDFDKRKEILGEMQRLQADQGANQVFMFVSALDVYDDKVGGAAEDAAGAMMGTRFAERLWFKS